MVKPIYLTITIFKEGGFLWLNKSKKVQFLDFKKDKL